MPLRTDLRLRRPLPGLLQLLHTLRSPDVGNRIEEGRLPAILADALQEAGCDNPDVLAHCRGPGPHVRGCWVVDLVLGKE